MKKGKRLIPAACLLLASVCLVAALRLAAARKIRGDTLPCQIVDGFGRVVATVYPSVMYKGNIYYWARMSADGQNQLPEGYLPRGYSYAGDISSTGTAQLTGDFQFAAVFDASGQLYVNSGKPDSACIRITTPWLKDSYVIFEDKG